jgi:hypothetical protein
VRVRSAWSSLVIVFLSAALAACGGGEPIASGGPTPPPNPSGPLEALLPPTLGGQPVVIAAASGDAAAALFALADGATLTSEMDRLNTPISEFEVAAGIHPTITIGVYRIGGLHWTPGSSQMARLVASMLGPVERMHVSSPTIAGKRVFRIIDRENDEYVAYAYISGQTGGDNVYFARGDEALMEEFFGSVR